MTSDEQDIMLVTSESTIFTNIYKQALVGLGVVTDTIRFLTIKNKRRSTKTPDPLFDPYFERSFILHCLLKH